MAAVSIKERILRQVVRDLNAGVNDANEAYRWTGAGQTQYIHSDIIVAELDEAAEEGEMGSIGYTHKRLPILIQPVLFPSDQAPSDIETLRSRMNSDIEAALATNYMVIETTTSVRLAIDTKIESISGIDLAEGLAGVGVLATVQYRHDRTSPTTLGSAITELTE